MFEQVPGQTQMVWKMTNVADTMQRFCCEWQTEHTPWSVTSDGMQSSMPYWACPVELFVARGFGQGGWVMLRMLVAHAWRKVFLCPRILSFQS